MGDSPPPLPYPHVAGNVFSESLMGRIARKVASAMENLHVQDAEFSTVETVETSGTELIVSNGNGQADSAPKIQEIRLPEKKASKEKTAVDAPSVIGKVFWKQIPGFREIPQEAGYSVEDAFEESGLNWETSKRPIQVVGGDVVPDMFAIYRNDIGKTLGVVGNTWQPVSNAAKFGHLEPWLKSGNARIVGVGEFNGGEKVSVVLQMDNALQTVRPGDDLGAYLIVTDHFDGRRGMLVNLLTLRLMCANGATMKAHLGKVQLRHSQYGEERFAANLGNLQGVYAQYLTNVENQKLLASRNVPGKQKLLDYVTEAMEFSVKMEDGEPVLATRSATVFRDIQERFERKDYGLGKGTWFDAVQAVGEYRNHGMGRSRVTRLDSLLHGPNALASQRDIQLALQMSA